ncbi:M23 family metallopeptidase [Alteriqipengyuania lutimaris]|nr:M23 family metallopeptidase [Alteriqipengyuania lutimaris]MBB3033048.1 murein DD-endopeptidase MepM/ murein hydrolase activator NlpD [Alteriqipengyuania lutimaris]
MVRFEKNRPPKRKTMGLVDRILTIIVTATITSMVWIVAGGSLIELSDGDGQIEKTRPGAAASEKNRPVTAETVSAEEASAEKNARAERDANVASLDRGTATSPRNRELGQLVIPVLNVRPDDLSDSFLAERGDGSRLHEAIDIMAPKGTSVIAAAPGTIERIYQSQTGGNSLYVRSSDKRTIYYYAHLDKYAPGLKEGQSVRRGQRLGAVGTTGNAAPDAPHLHFAIMRTTEDAEWWEPTNAINPFPLLTADAE